MVFESTDKARRRAQLGVGVGLLALITGAALWTHNGDKLATIGLPDHEVVENTTGNRAYRTVCSDTEEKCDLAFWMNTGAVVGFGGIGFIVLSLAYWWNNRY